MGLGRFLQGDADAGAERARGAPGSPGAASRVAGGAGAGAGAGAPRQGEREMRPPASRPAAF